MRIKKCPLKIKRVEEAQSRYCAYTKFSCRILPIQNTRVVSDYRTFTLCTVKFGPTLILLKITDQWYIVSLRFRFVKSGVFGVAFFAVCRRTDEGKRFDVHWRPISPASFHVSCLRRRPSKPSVYSADGLYKWFRRVRGPAATQATIQA